MWKFWTSPKIAWRGAIKSYDRTHEIRIVSQRWDYAVERKYETSLEGCGWCDLHDHDAKKLAVATALQQLSSYVPEGKGRFPVVVWEGRIKGKPMRIIARGKLSNFIETKVMDSMSNPAWTTMLGGINTVIGHTATRKALRKLALIRNSNE